MQSPRLRRFAFALTVLFAGANPASVRAQADAATALRRQVESLGDSARIRLLAPGIVVSDGLFLGFTHDSLRVSEADAVLLVGIDELEGLSVRGSKWLGVGATTAIVGAVTGATAGFFFGAKDCSFEPTGCEAQAGKVSLRWGLAFGAAGALVGAVVGSRLQQWKEVFP